MFMIITLNPLSHHVDSNILNIGMQGLSCMQVAWEAVKCRWLDCFVLWCTEWKTWEYDQGYQEGMFPDNYIFSLCSQVFKYLTNM